VEAFKRGAKMSENQKFGIEKYHRAYLIDRGNGFELVQYQAFRIERPHVLGYGMSIFESINDLVHNVQPIEVQK
jgi:hypothetical protein